jgi:hypothetical protein
MMESTVAIFFLNILTLFFSLTIRATVGCTVVIHDVPLWTYDSNAPLEACQAIASLQNTDGKAAWKLKASMTSS